MRVVAFSCVHWMSRNCQVNIYEYEQPLDYDPFNELCRRLLDDPPDVVVNLGDFTETYWERPPELPEGYTRIPYFAELIKLCGNHDRDDGLDHVVLDEVRYEHGHKLGPPGKDGSTEGYIEDLRRNVADLRLVHGHTHVPYLPEKGWPLDVGSLTFSRTYGEVVDGVPTLHFL